MCGISVVCYPFTRSSSGNQHAERVKVEEIEQSLELIKHRGPDERGTYVSPDGRVGEYWMNIPLKPSQEWLLSAV